MNSPPLRERRQHERFAHVLDVNARCLLSVLTTNDPPREFKGRIQNMSSGGACIVSSYPLQPALFVCCTFPMSQMPVSVPALMQVRWTVKNGKKSANFISGVQFVV